METGAPSNASTSESNTVNPTTASLPGLLPFDESDDTWQLVCDQKPKPKRKVFFVGNLQPDITELQLARYISSRAEKAGQDLSVQTIHVYPPHDGADNGLAFSRVAVHATDAHILRLPNFWIGRVYCRPWRHKPKEQPTHLGDSAGTTSYRLPSPTQANQEGELSSGEEATPTDANTISSLLKAAR